MERLYLRKENLLYKRVQGFKVSRGQGIKKLNNF